jgi:hypothetical protein
MPKEGDATYEQQCDVILKLKHPRLQMLSITLDDTTFLCQIREDLNKDLFAIGIQGQLSSHNQIHDFFSDHAKFEFEDGLLYCDGFLYVLDGLTRLQVL